MVTKVLLDNKLAAKINSCILVSFIIRFLINKCVISLILNIWNSITIFTITVIVIVSCIIYVASIFIFRSGDFILLHIDYYVELALLY